MKRVSKSYWQEVCCETGSDMIAIKSWFDPVVTADMVPESAEILYDEATDREKKMRSVMVDDKGRRARYTRTVGKTFSIKQEWLS